jgi:hypothetical protein
MSAQSLISQGYGGYAGWGDAEADADFKATGGSGKRTTPSSTSGGASGAITDPIAQAKAINDFYIQQNQPAISSLQAGIPEVKSIYENQANYLKSQQAPLEARYKSLIDSITKSTQTETSQEFGKRGVSTTSGLYDQTLNNRLNPQISQLGISQGQDVSSLLNQISGISGQETTDIRGIMNSIAQLQAGNAPSAVSSAQDIINAATSAKQFDIGTELKKQELAKSSSSVVEANGRKYVVTLDSNGNITSKQDIGSATTGSGSTLDPITQALLQKLLGGGTITTDYGNSPNYSPGSGEGTKSGKWIYHNGEWMVNTEA